MKTVLVVFVVAALQQHLPLSHAFAPPTTGRTAPQRLWHGGSTSTRPQSPSSLALLSSLQEGQETVNDPFVNDERSTVSRKPSPRSLHTTMALAFCTMAFGCGCALMISPLGAGAVSGGGLDYANMDLSGQDFAGGNYKGKDFTQGTCYCAFYSTEIRSGLYDENIYGRSEQSVVVTKQSRTCSQSKLVVFPSDCKGYQL